MGAKSGLMHTSRAKAPTPKKLAELRAEAMRSPCPSCDKPIGEHTPEEINVCAPAKEAREINPA